MPYGWNVPRVPLPARACLGLLTGALFAAGIAGTPPSAATPAGDAAISAIRTVPAAPAAPAAPTATEHEPDLQLSIRQLTPGALPEQGPIRIRGTLTNTGTETWTEIQVFPFFGEAAMTSAAELAAAADTEPTAVVGRRITEVRHDVAELAPGESVSYRLRVPRRLIGITTPGVHWFGVHALGQSETTPRDNIADARARTFLPYLPETEDAVETAVLVPLRQQIDHTTRGAVADTSTWRSSLENGGLRRSLDFGAAAEGRPVTWVLDPAVPDTLQQLAIGNPTRSVAPTIVPDDGEGDEGEGDPEDQTEDANNQEEAVADTAVARAADQWLRDAEATLGGEEVLLLPYGDLDLAAAADHAPELYPLARERAGNLVTEWGLATSPVAASPSGYLDEDGMALLDDDTLLVLTDRMFGAEQFPEGAPSVVDVDGHRAVVTSYAAASGGPGPDRRRAPVALRQRLLAEAAARLLSAGEGEDPAPLVMQLAAGFGGNPTRFWEGLDQDWVDLTDLSDIADGAAEAVAGDDLTYPPRQIALELDAGAFARVEQIREQGPVLQSLLTLNETIAARLTDEALAFLGYTHRDDQDRTTERLTEVQGWTQRRLEAISIEVPDAVNLSSESGRFVVTLRNQLRQPVTVGLTPETDNGVTINDVEAVVIPEDGHVTVEIFPHTDGTGVHNLTLHLTDADGTRLGTEATVPVRSSQVGEVIWWILGTGAGLLFLAIALRLVRRIRRVSASSTAEDNS